MNKDNRNMMLMFMDPILFLNAMTYLSINTVIPNFLNDLGASAFQISLVSALASIGTFISQPIFAQIAMGLPVKTKFFSKMLFSQRFIFIVYVLFIPFINKYYPSLSVVLFLLFWGVFSLFVGCYSPFFMGILSKVIPGNQRGRLLGFSGAVGNILALGSAYLVGVLLKNMEFPYNYTWIFGIGTVILILNAVCFALIEEEPEEVEKKTINYLKYLREIPHALKAHKEYGVAVAGNSFIVISNVALAFYSLAAIRNFNTGPEQIALFTAIGIVVSIFGSVVFGIMGDRIGHRSVLLIAGFTSILASIIVLSVHSLYAIYIGFALSSLSAGGYNISAGMNIIDKSPQGQVPLYISMNIMITLIAASLVTLMAGMVIDRFSFTPLFVITGICGMVGFTFYLFQAKR